MDTKDRRNVVNSGVKFGRMGGFLNADDVYAFVDVE
jgi:hypothetical protein